MNIRISGIDHACADVAERELYALSAEAKAELFARAAEIPEILGAVALSTCNRTEIYLSLADGADIDPFSLISKSPAQAYSYSGREAFYHLSALSAGLKSRLFAEDQILTQVKNSLVLSRDAGAADSILEVFFREAIAAAKRIKTELRFSHGDISAAAASKDIIAKAGNIHNILVIGNGEIGRAAAKALADAGCSVSMTVRRYSSGEALIPDGVSAVDYDARFEAMRSCQAVVSATASPNYTVRTEDLRAVTPLPSLFLDLAMPRDIDPHISAEYNVRLLDIDEVADTAAREARQDEALMQIRPIIDDSWSDLTQWFAGKARFDKTNLHSHFPLFIDSGGRRALVVGGGKIATRRVLSLSKFEFLINVVALEPSEELLRLSELGRINLKIREFTPSDLDGAFIAVAATNVREVNAEIASLADERGILVSVADRRDECSFYFPGIAEDDRVVIGVCGNGVSHHEVAKTAKKIREVLKNGTH